MVELLALTLYDVLVPSVHVQTQKVISASSPLLKSTTDSPLPQGDRMRKKHDNKSRRNVGTACKNWMNMNMYYGKGYMIEAAKY